MDNKAKPATNMPVMAPDLKPIFKPAAKPFLEASAVLTLACTEINIPAYPATTDKKAPMNYPKPTHTPKAMVIMIRTTTPTIEIVLY